MLNYLWPHAHRPAGEASCEFCTMKLTDEHYKPNSRRNRALWASISVASLQFLISSVEPVPAGRLGFTLTLYAACACLSYCPSEAIIKTGRLWCVLWLFTKRLQPRWIIKTVAQCAASLGLQIVWRGRRSVGKIAEEKKTKWKFSVFAEEFFKRVTSRLCFVASYLVSSRTVKQIFFEFEWRRGGVRRATHSGCQSVCINNIIIFKYLKWLRGAWFYLSRLERPLTQTYYQRGLSKSSLSVSAVFAAGSSGGEGTELSVSSDI